MILSIYYKTSQSAIKSLMGRAQNIPAPGDAIGHKIQHTNNQRIPLCSGCSACKNGTLCKIRNDIP